MLAPQDPKARYAVEQGEMLKRVVTFMNAFLHYRGRSPNIGIYNSSVLENLSPSHHINHFRCPHHLE
jgi:hypothetical protein